MKTILKGEANHSLDAARRDGLNWDEFRNNNHNGYLEVKNQALIEQGNECAYTGLWLGEEPTQTVHLDHFRKKSIYTN